jgi:hypothetical protein
MVGGMCSLLGTSVNMVAASLLSGYDAKQKIGLFEFFGVGAVICIITTIYMALAAWYLLPREVRKSDDESESVAKEEHRQYVVSFVLKPDSAYTGHAIGLSGITTAKDIDFVSLVRNGAMLPWDEATIFEAGDE